ncbi:helix-turn-helix transcriptional regulator [Mycobacterium rufum]|uniref:Helix-turn-helix transcriptional regulator n=2 Tax=Mycolicibacterium rufum TaxID=318424 RepID=A0A9X2YBB5_9MYCO|nr:ArsR family transcriptional regulator [Mycolicibacterium rufum]MCV7070623.1 helix-turn-helix transcriptional regulator [Mycolicibacterium rufum]
MTAEASTTAAPVFDALGDPHRLRMVVWLCDTGPCSTSAVTQSVPVTRQAATKHLTLLESAGVVRSEKRGRERIWSVQTASLTAAQDYLATLSQRWDRRIDRLRAFVED